NLDILDAVMVRSDSNTVLSAPEKIVVNGISGEERTAMHKKGKIRGQLFQVNGYWILNLAGNENSGTLPESDINHFFHSFQIDTGVVASISDPVYNNDLLGIRARVPGKIGFPSRRVVNGVISYYVKAYDPETDLNYILLMENTEKGNDILVDTVILKGYVQKLRSNQGLFDIRNRQFNYEGYPAQNLTFSDSSGGTWLNFSVLNVLRGNRNYFFTVYGSHPDSVRVGEHFMNTIRFIEPDTAGWAYRHLPTNADPVWAPAPFDTLPNDSTETFYKDIRCYSYDSVTSTNLVLSKLSFPPLYWASSDTALMRSKIDESIEEGEKLLSFEFTNNGPFRSAEAWITYRYTHKIRRLRLLVNGDSLIALHSSADINTLKSANMNKFFETYTPAPTPAPSSLFRNRAKELFDAFDSPDSIVFKQAIHVADHVTYTKEDLPLLYEGLKRKWNQQELGINNYYAGALAQVHDPSTLQTLQEVYAKAGPQDHSLKAEIMYTLALWRTLEAYRILTGLMLKGIPKDDRIYEVFDAFRDSSTLATPFVKQLLPLLKDSLGRPFVIQLCGQLLEEKLIQPSILGTYKSNIYKHAAVMTSVKIDEGTPYWYSMAMVRLLSFMNEAPAWTALNRFLQQPHLSLKLGAAAGLIRNNQPVPASAWLKIAADSLTRYFLYDTLIKLNKVSLFPKKYLNQTAISESELLDHISEYISQFPSINFLKEKIVDFKNGKYRFILYKLVFDFDGVPEPFLGIAGPFPVGGSALPLIRTEANGVFTARGYAVENIDDDLKEWLSQFDNE
ncbi:MAG: hypothetical protein J7578_23850, partial [Chitinophagaceae bacterium]|nr:hypothetical protein [Chitinophagaceae bacterium]